MTTDDERIPQKVSPWLARSALLLMPVHSLTGVALVVWAQTRYEPEFGYTLPMGPIALAFAWLVPWMPYVAIFLSVVNWFHKKEDRSSKDSALVVLTVCYTFIMGPVVYYFVALSVGGPI